MILSFIGIQGSGKGTQARLLAEEFDFTILEMGLELRSIIASKSELGLKLAEIMNAGNLVSPEIVGEVMKESIGKQTNEDLILDGYIRNLGNKNTLDSIVPNYKVVYFDLSRDKAIDRLLGRMYDPENGDTFPKGTEINPKNGNKLIKRDDDTENSILNRINAFYDETLPIVDLLRDEGKVIEIDADQSIDDVYRELKKKLGL